MTRPLPIKRRGQLTMILVVVAVVVAAAGILGLTMRGGGEGGRRASSDLSSVRRGSFDITIPTSGELTAQDQIEIRNRLDKRAVITEIVPEGTWVKPGDVLLRLNDDELRNEVNDAIDEVNVAEAAAIAAESELQIIQKERESEIAKTTLDRQTAELALKAWEEGADKSMRLELSLAVETAEKNLDRLADRFASSGKLLEQKFISLDEYKQDEIAMIEARAELSKAKLELEVYEKYKSLEERSKLQSALEQAEGEQERTVQSYDAKVRTAESELASKRYQLDSKRERLRRDQEQLSYCTVVAPSEGLVVYYSSLQSGNWGRGGDEGSPTVGTELPPNRTVIVLPNTSRMVAAVKVSEALSGDIKAGQQASVTSDAMPDRVMWAEVISVGVLAESGGWRDPNRRDYTVRLLLDEQSSQGLKPSMRCKASIFVDRVEDALFVPIQAVFRTGPLTYVYAPEGVGYAQKKVKTRRASELYIEVVEGLSEDEVVLLREPQPEEVVSRLAVPKGAGSMSREAAELAAGRRVGPPAEMNQEGGDPGHGPGNGPGMAAGDPGMSGAESSEDARDGSPPAAGEGEQGRRERGPRNREGRPRDGGETREPGTPDNADDRGGDRNDDDDDDAAKPADAAAPTGATPAPSGSSPSGSSR